MTTLVRTRRQSLRFDRDRRADSETPRSHQDNGGGRNSTGGRMLTRSDIVVVAPRATTETPPPATAAAATGNLPGVTGNGKPVVRQERVRDKHGRYTDGTTTPSKKLVIEIPKAKSTGANTPVQSSNNESPSGTTIPHPRHRINLRSKGTNPPLPPLHLSCLLVGWDGY